MRVPQDVVLWVLLFLSYVALVGDVISRCSMENQLFARDMHRFNEVRAKMIQSSLSGRYLHYCHQILVRYK